MPYQDPSIIDSGNPGFRTFSATPQNVNSLIDDLKDWFVAHDWIWPVVGLDHAGTEAVTKITYVAIPFHTGGSGGFSQVPNNGAVMGMFDGVYFVFWDPFSSKGGPHGSGDEDPTGQSITINGQTFPVVGVPLGTTAQETLTSFTGKATGNTRYVFTGFINDINSGSGSGTVTAKANGPSYNEPPWAPAGSSAGAPPPIGGGWIIFSPAAPTTGDKQKLLIYRAVLNGNLSFQVTFNGAFQGPIFSLYFLNYYAHVSSYQFVFEALPGQTPGTGDTAALGASGGSFYFSSCLYVPDDIANVWIGISSVNNAASAPVILTTSVDHDLEPGNQVWIDSFPKTGATNFLNNRDGGIPWVVATTPTPTTFTLTDVTGDGAVLTDLENSGRVLCGVFSACVAFSNSGFSSGNQNNKMILMNNNFKTAWAGGGVNKPTTIPMMLPIVNVGTENTIGYTSTLKSLGHAPYISVTFQDHQEARVCGILWDSWVELKNEDPATLGFVGAPPQPFLALFNTNSANDPGDMQSTLWVTAKGV